MCECICVCVYVQDIVPGKLVFSFPCETAECDRKGTLGMTSVSSTGPFDFASTKQINNTN